MINRLNIGWFLLVIGLFSCSSKVEKQDKIADENLIHKEITKDTVSVSLPEKVVENKILTEEDTIDLLIPFVAENFPEMRFSHYQSGNLDKDDQNDLVIVLERECKEEEEKTTDESMCNKVVFLKNKTFPNYEIVAMNDYIITCSDCGMRSIPQIVINNGYISFENLIGSFERTFEVITFKYNTVEKDWFLHRIGTENYSSRAKNNPDGEIKVRTQIRTKEDFGIVRFKDFNDE